MADVNKVVIIGGGQAGARAAQAMRDNGFTAGITIVAEERHPPYQRPPLSKAALTGDDNFSHVRIHEPHYYTSAAVDVLYDNAAIEIDRARRAVRLADGAVLPYDRLLIATGARVRRLEIPGADKEGVLYLRTYDDSQLLRRRLVAGSRVAVIGGGFIGLEVAASARTLGCEVTVLEYADRLMGRSVAREVGDWFAELHRSKGVDVRLSARIVELAGDASVDAVVLASGERIPVDTVIVGVGIVPNVEIAAAAGLMVDNGIVVDAYCRTSDENIYAAGDVAMQPHPKSERHIRLESYQNAQDQGTTAGGNLIGVAKPYVDRLWVWTDQYHVNLQSLGIARETDRLVYRGDPASGAFTVFYMRGNRIAAVNAIDTGRDLHHIERLMESGADIDIARLDDEMSATAASSSVDRVSRTTPITILVGTMTGNAEYAAEELQKVLQNDHGCDVEFLLMDKLGPEVFEREGVFLICTSTYGQGDVPDNAQALYERLGTERPDLTGVRYAVFGLGDSTYRDTFNFGGQNFDELLSALGATRLGERAKHDARSGVPAEDFGREWIRLWYESVADGLNSP